MSPGLPDSPTTPHFRESSPVVSIALRASCGLVAMAVRFPGLSSRAPPSSRLRLRILVRPQTGGAVHQLQHFVCSPLFILFSVLVFLV
jgi:hypothetical protein